MSNNIEGKVFVITGASSGLGEASARYLSTQGATVVLVFSGIIETDSEMKGTITASDAGGNNTTTGSFAAKRQ